MAPFTFDVIAPTKALRKRSKTCHKEVIMRSQLGAVKKLSEGLYNFV